VLRESGRGETVGGGEVLDVAPVLPASKARPSRSVERVIEERGWVDAGELERLTGVRRPPNAGDRWVVAPAALERAVSELRATIAGTGADGLDLAVLDERQRAALAQTPGIEVSAGRAWLAGQRTDVTTDHPWLAALAAAPFSPPDPAAAGADRAQVRDLVSRGLVVERDGVYFSASAVEEAGRLIAALLAEHPDGVTVAQVRDALGTTRKHVLPLLAHLDATGITRRRGDLRIGGPRLPADLG
jgi:selenocysteine-specific elongation factor